MHLFPTLLPIALSLAGSATAAPGTLGFALGSKNPDGSCKGTNDYELDFDAIAGQTGSKLVRGYAAAECDFAKNALPAAKAKGFKVLLGIWPDVDESFNKDKAAVQTYASQYPDQVYGVTVGSETLYRGNFTGDELVAKMQEVKNLVKGLKVGTADSWNKYADGTADPVIKSGPDFLLVNAFAYWQGSPIENATHQYFDDLMQAFRRIEDQSGGKTIEVWNGETGWPTDGGNDYNAAKAGTANAKLFYQQGVCGAIAWGYNAFYFEAFDEPWKPHSIGDSGEAKDETHWGAMTADRKPKFDLKCS